jgi:DnaJ-class molecular chaperone
MTSQPRACPFCAGLGRCPHCHGSGSRFTKKHWLRRHRVPCSACEGTGVCQLCSGKGTINPGNPAVRAG